MTLPEVCELCGVVLRYPTLTPEHKSEYEIIKIHLALLTKLGPLSPLGTDAKSNTEWNMKGSS